MIERGYQLVNFAGEFLDREPAEILAGGDDGMNLIQRDVVITKLDIIPRPKSTPGDGIISKDSLPVRLLKTVPVINPHLVIIQSL